MSGEVRRKSRYPSAEELAEELRRFLRGEPIEARPITRLGRTWRWCRRYPAAAVVVALTLLLAVVGPLVALNQARLAASGSRGREETRRRLYVADMVVAQQAWEAANVGRVRELLAGHVPGPGQTDLRGFQWYYLWQLCSGVGRPNAHRSPGQHLVAGLLDPMARRRHPGAWMVRSGVWDASHRRKPPASLTGPPGGALSLAFAPDGKTLASALEGCGRGGVQVWDVERRTLLRTLPWQAEVTVVRQISADGKYLAWGDMDGTRPPL